MQQIIKILDVNIFEAIYNWYIKLDSRYKTAFYIALIVNIISFFFFIVHQPLHNHGMRMPWIDPYEQTQFGRWFSYISFTLFNRADIPVIVPLASIILNIFSGLLVCLSWDKKSSAVKLTIITLLISLYPALLSSFYYTYGSYTFSFSIFFAALAMYISSSLSFLRIIAGSFFIMLAMSSNQPSISTALTIFMGIILIRTLELEKLSGRVFYKVFKQNILPMVISIIVGGILYILSLTVLDISMSTHATKTVDFTSLETIIERFLMVAKVSFNHLVITQPEFLPLLKNTLLVVVVLAFLVLIFKSFYKKSMLSRIILLVIIFCVSILATKAMFFLSSSTNFYNYRYNFALGFFYAFCFFILITYINKAFFKNFILLLSLFVIVKYSYSDLIRQHVIMRGQQHDIALANRILYRIESLSNIDFNKRYDLIRIGNYSNFRMEILSSKGHTFKTGGEDHMDIGDITAGWTPADIMKLLGSKVQWKYYGYNPYFREKISYAKNNLLNGRSPWPHESSVFIYEDTVYVYIQ